MLNSEHSDMLTSMNYLAEMLVSQSKYEVTEKMHCWTLELRKKVLGLKHLNMLTSMNNVALMLRDHTVHDT